MNFKRGNTYRLKASIPNVDIEQIKKIVFKFDTITKTYLQDGTGDVSYDSENEIFLINLAQEETLALQNSQKVKYEVAVKFTDDTVKRSPVYYTNSLETIIEEAI